MCCRSSAPLLDLLTPVAGPAAVPGCPRLHHPLWTETSSEEPSPDLEITGGKKHTSGADHIDIRLH